MIPGPAALTDLTATGGKRPETPGGFFPGARRVLHVMGVVSRKQPAADAFLKTSSGILKKSD
jgi:hypothetical protein